MVCKAKLRLVVSLAVEGGTILFENVYHPGVSRPPSPGSIRVPPPPFGQVRSFSPETQWKLEVIW